MNLFKKIPLQWLIIGFGVMLYLFHFAERDPSDPYSRPIISDAKGYYAYLPALFIYQDFDYEFVSEVDEKYYAVGQNKHIFIEVEGERVNKTFPGVALLYLPFFLIAHFLALLLGLEADGYSLIYQYFFDFGQFFYATLGLLLAAKFLQNFIKEQVPIFLSVVIMVLGTNLWFYTVYDQSVTHVYNFFLINLMLYGLGRFQMLKKDKFLLLSILAFCLILIVRPTGVLSLFLLFFFFSKKQFYADVYRSIISVGTLLKALTVVGLIFSVPLILWKLQSGNWIVYSYGEEGFNFSQSHFFDFLFSYAKGWWLYSPIILLSIVLGSVVLFKRRDFHKIGALFTFLALSIYIFSSWWCWYYGFSFGQRVMVDFYILFIFLLALVLSELKPKYSMLMSPVILFLVFLNIHQSYQHHHGYYQTPTPTSEIYWDNFLSFQKKARVYFDENEIASRYVFDFEENLTHYTGNIVEHSEARSGNRLTYVDGTYQFSGNIEMNDSLFYDHPVVVTAFVKSTNKIKKTTLVIEHRGLIDTYKSYPLEEYVVKGEWVRVEFLYENDFSETSDNLHLYFWNQDTDERVFIDDLEVTVLNQLPN